MPNTPTIAVSDNANGTGATVSVLGSSVGSTNTVEITLADRDAWTTTTYSRVGDGGIQVGVGADDGTTLNLTHAWRVRVKSTLAAVDATSDSKVVIPTAGYDAPNFYAAVQAQKALIDAVSGIGGRVYRCEDPLMVCESHVAQFPCVLIFPPLNEGETRQPADNARTTWGYPLTVAITNRVLDGFSYLEANLYRRRQIIDLFDRKKLEFPTTAKYRGRKVIVTGGPIMTMGGEEQGKYDYHLSTIKLVVEVDRWIGGGSDRP